MPWHQAPAPNAPARVLIVSQRAGRCGPPRALRFEFEDVVRAVDGADLVSSDRAVRPGSVIRRASAVLERLAPGSSAPLFRDRPHLVRRYDLLLVAVESLFDLQLVHPLSWLLRRARTSVCLIDEVWRKGLKDRSGELRLVRQFDHVLLSTAGTVEEMAALTGRPCAYLPPSVDAVALCPYPDPPPRTIDVYAMGRRSPATHAALLEVAERKRWFYLHDSLSGCSMPDHREHRRLLASFLKRARYFLAYPGKMDALGDTGGQQEIGFRYFEGAAAGTVLVGEPPRTRGFDALFGWPDAVVHLPYGATDFLSATAALEDDPARAERIRRRNVIESLRRHDHVYRWAEVLRRIGLPETLAIEARRRELSALSARVGDCDLAAGRPASG
jgi:hypothetical protein